MKFSAFWLCFQDILKPSYFTDFSFDVLISGALNITWLTFESLSWEQMTELSPFKFFFYTFQLWNILCKISQKWLYLRPWYTIHVCRFEIRCILSDKRFRKFRKILIEVQPYEISGILICQRSILKTYELCSWFSI